MSDPLSPGDESESAPQVSAASLRLQAALRSLVESDLQVERAATFSSLSTSAAEPDPGHGDVSLERQQARAAFESALKAVTDMAAEKSRRQILLEALTSGSAGLIAAFAAAQSAGVGDSKRLLESGEAFAALGRVYTAVHAIPAAGASDVLAAAMGGVAALLKSGTIITEKLAAFLMQFGASLCGEGCWDDRPGHSFLTQACEAGADELAKAFLDGNNKADVANAAYAALQAGRISTFVVLVKSEPSLILHRAIETKRLDLVEAVMAHGGKVQLDCKPNGTDTSVWATQPTLHFALTYPGEAVMKVLMQRHGMLDGILERTLEGWRSSYSNDALVSATTALVGLGASCYPSFKKFKGSPVAPGAENDKVFELALSKFKGQCYDSAGNAVVPTILFGKGPLDKPNSLKLLQRFDEGGWSLAVYNKTSEQRLSSFLYGKYWDAFAWAVARLETEKQQSDSFCGLFSEATDKKVSLPATVALLQRPEIKVAYAEGSAEQQPLVRLLKSSKDDNDLITCVDEITAACRRDAARRDSLLSPGCYREPANENPVNLCITGRLRTCLASIARSALPGFVELCNQTRRYPLADGTILEASPVQYAAWRRMWELFPTLLHYYPKDIPVTATGRVLGEGGELIRILPCVADLLEESGNRTNASAATKIRAAAERQGYKPKPAPLPTAPEARVGSADDVAAHGAGSAGAISADGIGAVPRDGPAATSAEAARR